MHCIVSATPHAQSQTYSYTDTPPVVDVYMAGLLVRRAERGLLSVECVAGAALALLGIAPAPLLDVDHVLGLVGGAVLRHLTGAAVHGVLGAPGALTSAVAAEG